MEEFEVLDLSFADEIALGDYISRRLNIPYLDSLVGSKDESILLDAGFEYGFHMETMWGRDKHGVEWVVWFHDDAGQGGATWYTMEVGGRKDRYGTMSYDTFKELFDSPA